MTRRTPASQTRASKHVVERELCHVLSWRRDALANKRTLWVTGVLDDVDLCNKVRLVASVKDLKIRMECEECPDRVSMKS